MKIKPKILIIVGPTASGKTSLSITLAQKFNGEIISADSRQVYRGLDLGTGKITKDEMSGVPHHLLDVADPRDTYTAYDYIRDGRHAIEDILSRNKFPIIVGGTFFYVDALLGRVTAPEVAPNEKLRSELESLDVEELFALLSKKDPVRAHSIDAKNKRRIIRALEIVDAIDVVPLEDPEELYDVCTLGIQIEKGELHKNIHKRIVDRIDAGMIDEVTRLHENGLSYERMEALGLEYRYIAQYLKRETTKEEMLEMLETRTRQFAKRQMTWLKRDESIVWVNPKDTEKVFTEVKNFLE